jgi:uncharacterized cupredoxin-like copper-binding protein
MNMTSRISRIALAAALLLAACSGGGHGSGMAGKQPAAQTVTQAASAQIAVSTTDTAQPIEPNVLMVSGADTNETSSPKSLN